MIWKIFQFYLYCFFILNLLVPKPIQLVFIRPRFFVCFTFIFISLNKVSRNASIKNWLPYLKKKCLTLKKKRFNFERMRCAAPFYRRFKIENKWVDDFLVVVKIFNEILSFISPPPLSLSTIYQSCSYLITNKIVF